MKKITQTMEYELNNGYELTTNLRDWYAQHPFNSGIDWEFQYMYAILEDEDCLAFCLLHPQWAHRFKAV
jgi:hypothetical protein